MFKFCYAIANDSEVITR